MVICDIHLLLATHAPEGMAQRLHNRSLTELKNATMLNTIW